MCDSKKYAIVTGASGGIGEAVARSLAKDGYQLFLTCHTKIETLRLLCDELSNTYPITCIPYALDLGDGALVAAMFEEYSLHFPGLDLLVNNAGISMVGLLSDLPDLAWDEMIQTNLSSVFYMSKHAIPLMLQKRSGTILNISSVWGSVGASCEVAYSAAKGGVNALTRALAKELAPNGIRVNAIACGLIDTPMNAHLSQDEMDSLYDEIPMGRAGEANEVARLVCQLAQSPDYLTGQVITMDGGWT